MSAPHAVPKPAEAAVAAWCPPPPPPNGEQAGRGWITIGRGPVCGLAMPHRLAAELPLMPVGGRARGQGKVGVTVFFTWLV